MLSAREIIRLNFLDPRAIDGRDGESNHPIREYDKAFGYSPLGRSVKLSPLTSEPVASLD
jgi:hypothetical protein